MSGENGEAENPESARGKVYTHTVGVALVEAISLFAPDSITEAVEKSWTDSRSTTYYGRDWYLSTILNRTAHGYYGRVGFVKEGDVNTLNFDPRRGDFIEGEASTGAVVPFFLSIAGRLSYQVLPGQVAERTFLTVFERLMNSAGDTLFDWKVSELAAEINYEDWHQKFKRIQRFDFTLDRPNPHYGDDHLIEQLVEGTGVKYLRLAASAEDGSIEVGSDLYRQSLDHVMRNYGRATITGVDPAGKESKWTKQKRAVGQALTRFFFEGFTSAPGIEELEEAAVADLPASTLTLQADDEQDDFAG